MELIEVANRMGRTEDKSAFGNVADGHHDSTAEKR